MQKYVFAFLVSLFIILTPTQTYTQEKTQKYFQQFDTNHDGILMRNEYENKLRLQDLQADIEEQKEYYVQILDLIYEKYDINSDNGLDISQWEQFSKDIYDYQQDQQQQL